MLQKEAKTIKELISVLREIDSQHPELTWYGFDDGSIILQLPDGTEIGYIDSNIYKLPKE